MDAETLNAYIKRLAHILLAMKPPAKCHFEVNAAGGLSYRYTPAWEEFKLWGQGNAVPTAEKARECAELFIQKFDDRYKNAKKQSLLPEDFPETLFFPFREFSKAAALYVSVDDKENKHHWTVSYQLLLQRYAGNVPMQYMEKAAWEGTELNLHIAKGGMLIGFDLGFPLIKNTSKQEPLHPYPIPDTEPIPSVLFRTLTNGKVAPFYMSEKGYLPAVKGAVGEEGKELNQPKNTSPEPNTEGQIGLHVIFYDKEGNKLKNIPDRLKYLFEYELGVHFIYEPEKELLFYDNRYTPTYKAFSDAGKVFRHIINIGNNRHTIIFGYNLYYFNKDTKKETAVEYGVNISIDKLYFGEETVSLIDLADFDEDYKPKGMIVKDNPHLKKYPDFNWQTFNLMRVIEHEWIGHGLLGAGHNDLSNTRELNVPGLNIKGSSLLGEHKYSAQTIVNVLSRRMLNLPFRNGYDIPYQEGIYLGTKFSYASPNDYNEMPQKILGSYTIVLPLDSRRDENIAAMTNFISLNYKF